MTPEVRAAIVAAAVRDAAALDAIATMLRGPWGDARGVLVAVAVTVERTGRDIAGPSVTEEPER